MRTSPTWVALLACALLLAPLGSAEDVEVEGEVSAGGSVGTDGIEAHITPYGWRAYVDAAVVDAFELNFTQVVLLVFEESLEAGARQALADLGLDAHVYEALHMAAVVLPRDLLADVTGVPGVLTIYRNERMAPLLDQSAAYVGAKTVWSLYHTTGKGITVLVVDSGVDGTHPDVKYKENLIENVVPTRQASGLVGGAKEGVVTSDVDGHGTHVAGIVGGTARALGGPDAGRYKGVAHGARLIGFQAGLTDPQTREVSFESVTVLEAFNYAIANKDRHQIRVVTNSWGTNGEFDPKSPVNVATLNMYKSGLVVLFAAGNEGAQGSHTMNKYAVAPWVLAVGAGDYFNQVASFSSRGTDPAKSKQPYDHPDLLAPGSGITSARALAGDLTPVADRLNDPSRLYATKSGSSMATPHVAGIAALLLEANPKLSPDDVYDILTATATPLKAPVWEAGAGYANALHAHQLAVKAAGNRDAFLKGRVKYAGPASGDPDYARDPVTVGYKNGAAVRLREPDKSVPAFLEELVGTIHGAVFLVGIVVLGLAAVGFGPGRRARVDAGA